MLSDAFIDHEVAGHLHSRILDHLRGCESCAVLVGEKIRLKRLVRAGARCAAVPPCLERRIRLHLGV